MIALKIMAMASLATKYAAIGIGVVRFTSSHP